MNSIKSRIRKLKFKLRHDFLALENVILVLAIFLCLFFTFQAVRAMSRSWELSERLAAERKNKELLEIEVEAAELENEYYKTDEYQELLARKQLDKKLVGENMVVLPKNSEEAERKYDEMVTENIEREFSNFEKWMKYLFSEY